MIIINDNNKVKNLQKHKTNFNARRLKILQKIFQFIFCLINEEKAAIKLDLSLYKRAFLT